MRSDRRVTYQDILDLIKSPRIGVFQIDSLLCEVAFIHEFPFHPQHGLNAELSSDDVEKMLAYIKKHWEWVKDQPAMQYQHCTVLYSNYVMLRLATMLAPLVKKSRFQILFPDLLSLESDITTTNLNESDMPVNHIVLADDCKHFIEVRECLLTAKDSCQLMHTQLIDGKVKPLSASEAERVIRHSIKSKAYWRAIERLYEATNNTGTLGGCVKRLVEGLRDGRATVMDGDDASAKQCSSEAIVEFSAVYESMSADMRQRLNALRDVNHSFEYYWNLLAHAQQKEYDALHRDNTLTKAQREKKLQEIVNNVQECVHITSIGLEGLLKDNHDLLYSTRLSGIFQASQIEELRKQRQDCEKEFIESLSENNELEYVAEWIDDEPNAREKFKRWVKTATAEQVVGAIRMSAYAMLNFMPPVEIGRLLFNNILSHLRRDQLALVVKELFAEYLSDVFYMFDEDDLPDAHDKEGWSAKLLEYIMQSQDSAEFVMACRILILLPGIDLYYRDPASGMTPILAAVLTATNENQICLDDLLEAGVDVWNAADKGGNVPAMLAIQSGNEAALARILMSASNEKMLRKKNKAGATIVNMLVSSQNEIMLKNFILFVKLYNFEKPLLESLFLSKLANDQDDVLIRLLREFNFTKYINTCFEPGLDNNLLWSYVLEGNEQVARVLIESGADIHFTYPESGRTALGMAVNRSNLQAVKLLLKLGASYRHADIHGLTPWVYALRKADFEIVTLLLELYQADGLFHEILESTFQQFIKNPDLNLIDLVFRNKLNPEGVDYKNSHGETLLMCLAQNGELNAIQYLLTGDIDLEARCPKTGKTALLMAIENGHVRVVMCLLGARADLTVKDANQRSALDYAAMHGDPELISLSLPAVRDHGYQPGKDGRTALMLAADKGNAAAFRILLYSGLFDAAAVNSVTNESAFSIAKNQGRYAVLAELAKYHLESWLTDARHKANRKVSFIYSNVTTPEIDAVQAILVVLERPIAPGDTLQVHMDKHKELWKRHEKVLNRGDLQSLMNEYVWLVESVPLLKKVKSALFG